jgi:hypothetical protein
MSQRLLSFVTKELKEILPPTLFFVIGFNLIVLTSNLLLADYLTAFGSFLLATTAALVVGKAAKREIFSTDAYVHAHGHTSARGQSDTPGRVR